MRDKRKCPGQYLGIFLEQCKMSLMAASIFRANFILMLFQSILNSLMSVLCVDFIYGSVETIAGWSRDEMIILLCTSLVVNQLYRGLVHPNQMRFLSRIINGSFDRLLLRPINIYFQINTGSVDISSLLSGLAPVVIIIRKLGALHVRVSLLSGLLYILLILNGVAIITSFMMLLYSSAFVFIKADGLSNLYFSMMSVSEKPKEILEHKSIILSFLFLIPAIPLANAPAGILLGKEGVGFMLMNMGAGAVFFFASRLAVHFGIRRYCSASS